MTGSEFRLLRQSMGLTQDELGRIMGMPGRVISALERDNSPRRPTKIHAAFLRYIVAHPPQSGGDT